MTAPTATNLINRREVRFSGRWLTLALDRLPGVEQDRIRALYDEIDRLRRDLEPDRSLQDRSAAAARWVADGSARNLRDLSQAIGASLRPITDREVRQVLHDIRGGSLNVLVLMLNLPGAEPAPVDLAQYYLLARDHLKIMRQSLDGLDPEARRQDEAETPHSAALLREKWGLGRYRNDRGPVTVDFTSSYDGVISARCMEFASLDRVLYNLVNNAARFTTDQRVDFDLSLVRELEGHHARFTIANRIEPAQATWIRDAGGPDRLWQGGFTTGGQGDGLNICAQFVCTAYGLVSIDEALTNRHIGIALTDDSFTVWVHWPV